jgi:tight adherence protein B
VLPSLTLVMIFLSASLGIAAGYSVYNDLFSSDRSRARERMEQEFRREASKSSVPSPLFKAPAQVEIDLVSARHLRETEPAAAAQAVPEEKTLWARMEATAAQSGLGVTLRQVLIVSAVAAGALAGIGFLVHGLLLGLCGLLIGGSVPYLYVRHRFKARRNKLLAQLPNAFDLMARVIRSGHSVPQSFQSVAESFDDPISGEFGFCQEQQNLGLLPELTYRDLARRTDVLEIKIFVMAMLIQRQTGGNLSEVLERLATMARERGKLRNRVKTLTAEGRMQAVVLMCLPVVLFLVMRAINHKYTDVLLDHPGLMGSAGAAMLIGWLWIRKIVNFDF